MINLRADDTLTKWFVWCCDNLVLTVTREYGEGKPSNGLRRTGAYYIERGTTLCHIFWASLWVPLIATAGAAFVACLFIYMHVDSYEHGKDQFGIAAALFPEGIVACSVLVGSLPFFIIMGASRVGFFKLLWVYLKGIKSKICSLVRFDEMEDADVGSE